MWLPSCIVLAGFLIAMAGCGDLARSPSAAAQPPAAVRVLDAVLRSIDLLEG